MPIPVVCSVCAADYTLRDEYAGRRVKCPKCQNLIEVPDAVQAEAAVTAEADPGGGYPEDMPEEFRRDKFFLNQKLWAIKEKYRVLNEEGEPILFVERPVHFVAGCLAACVGIPIIVGGIIAGVILATGRNADDTDVALGIAVGLLGVILGFVVLVALYPKRHVYFYADEGKRELLLEVKQEQKVPILNAWYTLVTPDGDVLARFRKNHLHGIFRKRWYIHSPEWDMQFVVKEDSIIMSLLRRTIGYVTDEIPLLGLAIAAALRTNYVFTRHGDTKVIGEFNRKLTIRDQYVIDLSDDEARLIDRRIAVVMGVLLDTGERR